MVLGDTDRCPWDMGTFGSLTTRMFGPALRAAAAPRRAAVLLAARLRAARRREGESGRRERRRLRRKATGAQRHLRRAREGAGDHAHAGREGGSALGLRVHGDGPLAAAARRAGEGDGRRRSTPATSACPGMLYARILRPPAHGATLQRVDTSAAAKVAGVTVVNQDGLVAVLHADPEVGGGGARARQGRVERRPARGGHRTDLRRPPEQGAGAGGEGAEGRRGRGARAAARSSRAPTRTATSRTRRSSRTPPLAKLEGGKVTVWASTQTPFPTHDAARAGARPRPEENVRVITPYVGGGFGGKSAGRQADGGGEAREASPASRCRSAGRAPRSSSTTPSTRRRS